MILNYAQEAFRSDGDQLLVPRQKFNFAVQLGLFDRNAVTLTRVSSTTVPSFSADTVILNQYNKKRVVQTKLNYDPITITFYDTFDSEWHDIMTRYIAHYFNGTEGIDVRTTVEGNSTVNPSFETDFGFTPTNDRYFFPTITIIQNGYRNQYRETVLNNPIITNISGDTLDYSDSNAVMYSVTFQPESIQTRNIKASARVDPNI
jgi:hypothetical protein